MDESNQQPECTQCGSPLSADGPARGLCPRCLVKEGLDSRRATRTAGPRRGGFVPPEVADLAPHFPQLEILELVGQGGMGAVYKARQRNLDRLVALKILPSAHSEDPAFTERFTREARALARLAHPHVVAIHDFGEVDGMHFFVMEFVEGANLREVMQAGRLTPREALALVPQICEALQYAHDQGIVHRDIKPENVLLDRRGRVKIADFGLAKLLGPDTGDRVSLTATGELMGTPAYMAPEQIERPLEVDHRADIYAVGVVFYEMLTSELPLGRFDPPSKRVEVDVRLDRVVLRALEKEPARRYQLASDVKLDLESIGQRPFEPGTDVPDARAAADVARFTSQAVAQPAASVKETRREVTVRRPVGVTRVAITSFVLAGVLVLTTVGGFAVRAYLVPRFGRLMGGPLGMPEILILLWPVVPFAMAVWHVVAGFAALDLRPWGRYSLIGVFALELLNFPLGTVPAIVVLAYLFQKPVRRLFELGPGPVTLPAAEADAVERYLDRDRWT